MKIPRFPERLWPFRNRIHNEAAFDPHERDLPHRCSIVRFEAQAHEEGAPRIFLTFHEADPGGLDDLKCLRLCIITGSRCRVAFRMCCSVPERSFPLCSMTETFVFG